MLDYENYSHYVQDERGALYLCPLDRFGESFAAKGELEAWCITDEANVDMHAYEGY